MCGADKLTIVKNNTIFTTLSWFLALIWVYFWPKITVFVMPMYEVVRRLMFRVVRSRALRWVVLSCNFWNYNCSESLCTRAVRRQKSTSSIYEEEQYYWWKIKKWLKKISCIVSGKQEKRNKIILKFALLFLTLQQFQNTHWSYFKMKSSAVPCSAMQCLPFWRLWHMDEMDPYRI